MLEAYARACTQDVVTDTKADSLPIVGTMLALISCIIAEH